MELCTVRFTRANRMIFVLSPFAVPQSNLNPILPLTSVEGIVHHHNRHNLICNFLQRVSTGVLIKIAPVAFVYNAPW